MTVPRPCQPQDCLSPSVKERNGHLSSIYYAPGLCQADNLHVFLLCDSAFTPSLPSHSLYCIPSLSRPISSFWKSSWERRVLLFPWLWCHIPFYFHTFHTFYIMSMCVNIRQHFISIISKLHLLYHLSVLIQITCPTFSLRQCNGSEDSVLAVT